ncbi:MAG: chloride channel protein [Prevotellaceae bacterium]|nr:chloride channel protein [Prevotellaceae bacterium]
MKKIAQKTIDQILSLGNRKVLILLAFIVGIASGLAAVLLKHTITGVKFLLTSWFNAETGSLLYLAYPGIGILITVIFIKYFVGDNIGHGITRVLYAISRKKSKLKSHNCYSSVIASSFTIGFGGSVGAEAPIVLTGAAIGSNIGQYFRQNYKTITLLIGCGAAGAVAGIFKAPLAGVVFTLEILMLDLTLSSIVPLLISSLAATLVSYLFLGRDVEFTNLITEFSMHNIPLYIVLGIFCGLVALYFTRATLAIENRLAKMPKPYKRWITGSVGIGILIFLFPPLYGEGYGILSSLLTGNPDNIFQDSLFYAYKDILWIMFIYLAAIIIFKVVAMALTNGCGGTGGTFGPTLFIGGISGFLIAKIINTSGIATVPEVNFALVGMGGMMAAVMHAPLTAIFLIAEITGGYDLFFPLMIASVCAFLTNRSFERHSIYTRRLALRGELITHNKDQAALTLLSIGNLIEKDFISVKPNDKLGDFIKIISMSNRNIFPVLDDDGKLLGLVYLDSVRRIMFDSKLYESVFVRDFMFPSPQTIHINDTMNVVVDKFEETKKWNLPVVDENGIYRGFLSKSQILTAYRDVMVEVSEE